MGAEHGHELLRAAVLAQDSHAEDLLARSALELPPLYPGQASACLACGSRVRRLWHGLCAWCGADVEDFEDLEQD